VISFKAGKWKVANEDLLLDGAEYTRTMFCWRSSKRSKAFVACLLFYVSISYFSFERFTGEFSTGVVGDQTPREGAVSSSYKTGSQVSLDWSRSNSGEIVRLVQSCSKPAEYGEYLKDVADEIALKGANIRVFSRITGSRVLTRWNKDEFLRENGRVIVHGVPALSWARHRQLAWAIVKCAKLGFLPGFENAETLADIVASSKGSVQQSFKVWNTQSDGAVHDAFKEMDGYVSSEYFPNEQLRSGDMVSRDDGLLVRHEDLLRPSFSFDSLDLIISTEVFEHIPDPYLAHQQVLKILKKGGVHVFTVPFNQYEARDQICAKLAPDGRVTFTGTPNMHGDPLRPEGVPVFTIFGHEMIDKLCTMGFEAHSFMIHIPREGILGSGAIVFVARKS